MLSEIKNSKGNKTQQARAPHEASVPLIFGNVFEESNHKCRLLMMSVCARTTAEAQINLCGREHEIYKHPKKGKE